MFDLSKEKANPINPLYGQSLLAWLREELRDKIEITEPAPEDWGWYSELRFDGNFYLIGASVFFDEGDDPLAELEWVFQVAKHRSFKEKVFGKNKMDNLDTCLVFFKNLFEQHGNFKEVQIA